MMNNFGAPIIRVFCFRFSVFRLRKFGGMSFGFEYGKLEKFCTGGTPCRPGQSRSGTVRARAIDSLPKPFGFRLRQFGEIRTGGAPVQPGSIAQRLTDENHIKCKKTALITPNQRGLIFALRANARHGVPRHTK